MRKALATIDTEIGRMTIYYNGDGEKMTAEKDELVEEIGYKPESLKDAEETVNTMYCCGGAPWFLEWIEEY